METKKIILLTALSFNIIHVTAQPVVESRKGNIRAQGNLAVGYLFAKKQPSAYLTGDVDIFIHNNISVTGETWYNFKLKENLTGLQKNHSTFWGFNYHFLSKGRFDPYIKTGYINNEGIISQSAYGAAPLISGVVGCNYYVGSVFHFFVKARLLTGIYHSNIIAPQRLDEMKFSAGLGWNFRVWKPKM
jgi:hypothetical protein